MTFCPTTKWRPSNGFRASTSTELQGMWRNSAFAGLPLMTVALRVTWFAGRALFVLFPVADVFRAVVFSFLFFIGMAQCSMKDTTNAGPRVGRAFHFPLGPDLRLAASGAAQVIL